MLQRVAKGMANVYRSRGGSMSSVFDISEWLEMVGISGSGKFSAVLGVFSRLYMV